MKELTIDHKNLLEDRLYEVETFLSEYCFSNLFLFRNTHQYKVGIINECVFITGKTYDGKSHIMPCCNINEMTEAYFNNFIKIAEDFDIVFPVPKAWVERFDSEIWNCEAKKDDMDYIYTKEKLWQFPGRKLHSKRNLFRQFVNSYESRIEEINDENTKDAIKVLDNWQANMRGDKSSTDYYACFEGLEKREILNLKGFIVYVDDEPVGFTLGEILSKTVFGLHFAKANRGVKGIYQYLFSKTSELIGDEIEYINLEQDLGIVGLRETKLSYQPDFMAKKYRLWKK